ncbi:MAG: helix-turn-helix domain-containing protein [Deltaproteobacteria bacterium]|nr:helix-turn-helix domain-containing protein [Deltaproteobacteria bacterium]
MNNHHQNAGSTLFSRALIVQGVLKEEKRVREVAKALGVSQRTVYKWLAGYRSGGKAALHSRGSWTRRRSRPLPVGRVATIAAMRRMRMHSSGIAFSLSMPLSAVTLELRRFGLNRLPHLEPKLPVILYEHQDPGDMIHLDSKKLGKIDGRGHRIHGDRSKRKRGIVWE